jgi:hypothetical protein
MTSKALLGAIPNQALPKAPPKPCCRLPFSNTKLNKKCPSQNPKASSQRCEIRTSAVASTSGLCTAAANVEVQEKPTSAGRALSSPKIVKFQRDPSSCRESEILRHLLSPGTFNSSATSCLRPFLLDHTFIHILWVVLNKSHHRLKSSVVCMP